MTTSNELPPLSPLEPVSEVASPLEPVTQPDNSPVVTPEPVSDGLFTLDELAEKAGQLAKPAPDGGKYLWRHRVAETMHGWYAYAYHYADKPIRMSEADYKAALDAVDTGTPHEPAVRK